MDVSKRMATSVLLGFVSFVLLVPASCGALVLWNEHRYGDVDSNGPVALLGGFGVAAVLALLVALTAWSRSKPQQSEDRFASA